VSEDVSLQRYFRAVRRQSWLIALCVAVALAAAAVYVTRQQPVYQASMKILVGQGGGPFKPVNGGAVDPFTSTMADLLESDVVAADVISQLKLKMTPQTLLGRLSVSTKPQTAVLAVSYESGDKVDALRILRQSGAVLQDLVSQHDVARTGQSAVAGTLPGNVSAAIFDPPHLEPSNVSPRPAKTLALAGVLALVIGCLLALARQARTPRLDTREQAEEWFRAPVLAELPKGADRLDPVQVWFHRAAGANRLVRAIAPLTGWLRGRSPSRNPTIVVTSAEGIPDTSLLTSHLAAALVASGEEVVCVSLDDRGPGIKRYLPGAACSNGRRVDGALDVIDGRATLASALQRIRLDGRDTRTRAVDYREHDTPSLLLLAAGGRQSGNARPLSADDVVLLAGELAAPGRYVIIDAPPLLLAPQSVALASEKATILIVARQGVTTKADAEAVHMLLARGDQTSVGVVLAHPRATSLRRWRRRRRGPPALSASASPTPATASFLLPNREITLPSRRLAMPNGDVAPPNRET
jgi:capsular polysaccharide biosynthesis protein/septum formation inhibitor-activating ATPase MinD